MYLKIEYFGEYLEFSTIEEIQLSFWLWQESRATIFSSKSSGKYQINFVYNATILSLLNKTMLKDQIMQCLCNTSHSS